MSSTGTSAVVTHRHIDAFGNSGTYWNYDGISYDGGPFIYTGRFLDNLTGLQWNLNRWYDASLGRWLSQDPIGFKGGDFNLYRYVGNNPTTRVDPTGRSWAAPLAVILLGVLWMKICKEYAVNKAFATYPNSDKQMHCMAACVYNRCTALINPRGTFGGMLYWELATAIEKREIDITDSVKDIVVGLEGILKSYNLLSPCANCCKSTVFK